MNFEASGNLSDWPRNVAGKPAHAAVFALQVEQTQLRSTILWKAEFEDLQKAMYWAAKKEIEGPDGRDAVKPFFIPLDGSN